MLQFKLKLKLFKAAWILWFLSFISRKKKIWKWKIVVVWTQAFTVGKHTLWNILGDLLLQHMYLKYCRLFQLERKRYLLSLYCTTSLYLYYFKIQWSNRLNKTEPEVQNWFPTSSNCLWWKSSRDQLQYIAKLLSKLPLFPRPAWSASCQMSSFFYQIPERASIQLWY